MSTTDKNKELLERLMTLTIEQLIEEIQSGEASPSHLNVARQLLKDNNVMVSVQKSSPLSNLVDVLPFDEYADGTNS